VPGAAGVLAAEAGVTAATASSHLHKLTAGGLLTVEVAGRRRNYRLAGPDVGVLVEALERLAPALPVRSLEQSQRARARQQKQRLQITPDGLTGFDLRRFRHNAADPALAGQLAAYLTRHAPRSPNAPGLLTATATCMRPTCWQSSPGTAPAR
jgi:hypothetical protein